MRRLRGEIEVDESFLADGEGRRGVEPRQGAGVCLLKRGGQGL